MEEPKNMLKIIPIIVVVLALGLGISYLVSRNNNTDVVNEPVLGSDYYVSVIQVKHQYKNGEHTYVGSLDLPNSCYNLDSVIEKAGESSATIKLSTDMNIEEMCAQAVVSKDFRLQVDGPMNFTINGILNGRAVDLNIFEVPFNQDIDMFEINIKG